jgi:hypothetical protein
VHLRLHYLDEEGFLRISGRRSISLRSLTPAFVGVVRPQVWPYSTPKGYEQTIVKSFIKQSLEGGVIVYDSRGKAGYEKNSYEESFIPKFEQHAGVGKKGKTHFNNVSMFMFS